MTIRQFLRLLLRRWYLVLVGAIVTVAGIVFMTHREGVYFAQFNAILLAPKEQYFPNQIENPPYPLAPLAGVVAAEWNDSNRPLFTASGDTTVVGLGVRRGAQVRVPNEGSQWQPIFSSPIINVQVVDRDPETVQREAKRIGAELKDILRTQQQSAGVRAQMQVTLITSPDEPAIAYIAGSRPRTAVATGLIGAAATLIIVYWIDRGVRRPRQQDLARPPSSEPLDDPDAEVSDSAGNIWRSQDVTPN